jgi:hypothetical protein
MSAPARGNDEVATLFSSGESHENGRLRSTETDRETAEPTDELLVAQSNNGVKRCRLPSRIDTEEKTDGAGNDKRSRGPGHGQDLKPFSLGVALKEGDIWLRRDLIAIGGVFWSWESLRSGRSPSATRNSQSICPQVFF